MDVVDSLLQKEESYLDVPSILDFPCLFPENPDLCQSDKRFKTFPKEWNHEISAREFADAGFCYSGRKDSVFCFYCNEKLYNWEPNERPWFEHAKWFPLCQYLLYKQGVYYVRNVCLKFPHIRRPEIKNACKSKCVQSILEVISPEPKRTDPREEERNRLMEEVEVVMRFDSSVQYAKKLGFSHKHIQNVVSQHFQENKPYFKNRDELINLLLDSGKEVSLCEKIKALELNSLCNVCRKNEKESLCLPCGHQSLCWFCVQSFKYCDICNSEISEKIRTYRV